MLVLSDVSHPIRQTARAPRRALATLAIALLMGSILAGVSTWATDASDGGVQKSPPKLAPDSTVTINGSVYGKLGGCVDCGTISLAGDAVDAVGSSCPIVETDAGACTPVATALTNSTGAYTLSVASGTSYYVYSTPLSGYGGDTVQVTVSDFGITGENLYAYDQLQYSNQTFVLPAYTSLASYLHTPNGDTQVPVLSFSADGVYYVNSSSDLVFYSLATGTVKLIAPWTQLYAPAGYAGEQQNAFFLTLDGSYAYELGCDSACATGSPVVVHAVNVTTGRTFVWTLTRLTYGATANNVQVNMVGLNGNDSIMSILTSATSNPVYAYNIWNSTQWLLGNLNYFEANNCYWVPALDSYIDIQAAGSAADGIQQFQLQKTGGDWVHLSDVFHSASYPGGGVTANWVNGLTLNLTLGEISYSYGDSVKGTIVSAVYAYGPSGILSHRVNAVETARLQGLSYADEHRLEITTGAPTPEGYFSPYFYNQSWVINPFTSSTTYYDTNVTEGTLFSCASSPECGLSSIGESSTPGPVASHFFVNGSYAVSGYSVDCARTCPLLGTTPGTTLGTVYWLWNSPLPEFPFPSTADLAQTTPYPLVLSSSTAGSTVSVQWTPPTQYPVANYTFFWGTTPGVWTQILNLSSTASGDTITGLSGGETVYYGAEVWNLHFHSALTTGSATIGSTPAGPTGLSVSSVTTTSVSLTWTNPAGTMVNDTVYYGTVCGDYPLAFSTGGAATSATISGLSEGTAYCFAVAAWSITGMSALSSTVTATPSGVPSAPTSLHSVASTLTSVSLAWTQSPGTVFNNTLYSGNSCGTWNIGVTSTGGATDSHTVSGLAQATSYCFAVSAWNAAGQSTLSSVAVVSTVGLPSAPTGIAAGTITTTTVPLTWTNPPGTVTNDTVFQAASSFNRACSPTGDYRSAFSVAIANHFTVTGLVSGSFYCFAVAAWNATGMSALDPLPTSVETLHVPLAPMTLTATSSTTSTVSLSWTNPPGTVTNNTVFWGPTCGTYPDAHSMGRPATTYTVTGLKPGTEYCFAVSAWNVSVMSLLNSTLGATVHLSSAWPTILGLPDDDGVLVIGALGALLAATAIWVVVRRKGRNPPATESSSGTPSSSR
ncbi:MAG: fibronectin type III domain-containing protein [Thermoplasmata archaeon]